MMNENNNELVAKKFGTHIQETDETRRVSEARLGRSQEFTVLLNEVFLCHSHKHSFSGNMLAVIECRGGEESCKKLV